MLITYQRACLANVPEVRYMYSTGNFGKKAYFSASEKTVSVGLARVQLYSVQYFWNRSKKLCARSENFLLSRLTHSENIAFSCRIMCHRQQFTTSNNKNNSNTRCINNVAVVAIAATTKILVWQ